MDSARRAQSIHRPGHEETAAARETVDWALSRLADRDGTLPALSPEPPLPPLTEEGVGSRDALRLLREVVFPTALPADHPRYLAFVPGSPTVVAVLADMALSAAGIYAGTRLEAGLAVAAEDAALRWLADAAGMPASTRGTFVSGGSIASLSALVAARGRMDPPEPGGTIVAGASGHSSLEAAAAIMGCRFVAAPPADDLGRLDARTLEETLAGCDGQRVVAVCATAGATNSGAVDDLTGVAEVCERRGLWLHVDAAYGGGALLSPRARPAFAGIERADSVTIDPHKWLFTPYDCAAVLYRDPLGARRALSQHAAYLEAMDDESGANPSDLAIHLTRRARGVPLWASLLAYGTAAFTEAVDACLDLTGYAARRIREIPQLELAAEPQLSVVLFRRRGWQEPDYAAWSETAIRKGTGMVIPTRHQDEPVLRLCFVNPLTSEDDIDRVLASL